MWRGPRCRTDGLRCSLAGLDPAILDEAVEGRPAAAAEAARHRHQHARVRVRLGRATGQVADAALRGQVTLVTRACWMSVTCSSAQVMAMPRRVSFPTAGSNTTGTDLSPVRRRDESEGRFGVNGWKYWYADTPSGLRPSAALRVVHRARGYVVAHPAGENTDQAECGRDQPDL
jgi:hypothetical protein